MALKVKAVEKKIKFDKDPNNPGVYRYVMSPELYIPLAQEKVIKEAALRSGVSKGVITRTVRPLLYEMTASNGVWSGLGGLEDNVRAWRS
jgi:hypothetical protein